MNLTRRAFAGLAAFVGLAPKALAKPVEVPRGTPEVPPTSVGNGRASEYVGGGWGPCTTVQLVWGGRQRAAVGEPVVIDPQNPTVGLPHYRADQAIVGLALKRARRGQAVEVLVSGVWPA